MRPAEICFGNAQPVLWAIRGHGTGPLVKNQQSRLGKPALDAPDATW
jgi:hypothetical protein